MPVAGRAAADARWSLRVMPRAGLSVEAVADRLNQKVATIMLELVAIVMMRRHLGVSRCARSQKYSETSKY
ncbi:hypothetical protein D3C76_1036380 [compost metagenome]